MGNKWHVTGFWVAILNSSPPDLEPFYLSRVAGSRRGGVKMKETGYLDSITKRTARIHGGSKSIAISYGKSCRDSYCSVLKRL